MGKTMKNIIHSKMELDVIETFQYSDQDSPKNNLSIKKKSKIDLKGSKCFNGSKVSIESKVSVLPPDNSSPDSDTEDTESEASSGSSTNTSTCIPQNAKEY